MMDEGEGEDEDGNDDDDDDDDDDADAAAHAADDSDYARDDIYDHVTYKLTDTVDAHVIAELQTNLVGCRGFGVQRPIPFDFLVEGEFLRSSISSYLEDPLHILGPAFLELVGEETGP